MRKRCTFRWFALETRYWQFWHKKRSLKCVFWTFLVLTCIWRHGQYRLSGDAYRGWSAGENRLRLSFPTFEKKSKNPILKRPLCEQKYKIFEKLSKSEFWLQNRACHGQISGCRHLNRTIWLKIAYFMIFWNFHPFRPNSLFTCPYWTWYKICQNCPFWASKYTFPTNMDTLSSFLASKIKNFEVLKIF